MHQIRVLVVDDSAVSRKLLGDLFASDPEIVLAGTAGNGNQALERIRELRPDLVTLDVEMPGMDGLQALVEIRKIYWKLPVIMFSSLTERGAAVTLEALTRGASDYVTKPSHRDPPEGAIERVREDLIRKIKSLCPVPSPQPRPAPAPAASSIRPPSRIDIVAIGTSTGGPNALGAFIPLLPPDFPVPVVIVQHMPPLFTRLLAERLNMLSPLEVKEGKQGQRLQRGQIWIAPGDHHMTVTRKGTEFVLGLNDSPPENSCRPAVDVLFRSVAQSYGPNVLAVVLTGMGSDGTRGASDIHGAGGQVIVQDEASSVVWGMPGSVVAANLADRIYPLGGIGAELVRRVSIRRSLAMAAMAAHP
ncbi:MAG TPA: chemotaxis response regulator protein-glutamate methylesterase [Terriglobales bacterium]|nr:chemotaxis response regulator protein-glutamate methylesterase [Terriglobales bacterium]